MLYVVNVKINGDYNRNGNPADDPHKDDPVTFAGPKGFVILANNNDSDGDGEPDCDSVSGQYTIRNNDLSDIYQICIPKLGIPASAIPSGMTVSVQVLNPSNDTASFDAIVFPKIETGVQGGAGLDFETASAVGTYFGGTGTAILGIEGRTPGKEVRVRITVKISGNILATDELRLLVAPFLVLDNTTVAAKVYVADDFGGTFVSDVTAALNNVIPVELYGSSQFIQDFGVIGAQRSAPGQNNKTQCSMMGLSGTSYKTFIADDTGYFYMGDCCNGGNIGSSPAIAGFSYGRLIVGNVNVPSSVKSFLQAQKVQTDNGNMIELPVDWLQTGHVDELVAFVPVASGFKVLVADLQLAIDLLRNNPTNETTGGYNTRAQILATYDANSNQVAAINSYLATVRTSLAQGLGMNANDFIKVPVPFTVIDPKAKTALPNMVNMIVVKNASGIRRLIIPQPYFSPFKDSLVQNLVSISYTTNEFSFADTSGPHALGGEAHCASNVRRNAP